MTDQNPEHPFASILLDMEKQRQEFKDLMKQQEAISNAMFNGICTDEMLAKSEKLFDAQMEIVNNTCSNLQEVAKTLQGLNKDTK